MIDTLNLRLTRAEVEGVDFLNEIAPSLNADTIATHTHGNGDEVITGCLDNLKLSISHWQVRISGGSLCKWMLGDNFQTLGRRDIQDAITRLSDELHLPVERAAITRLDVAANIITQHPPGVYINHFGVMPYAKRLQQPDSLYYQKRDEQLCVYDKVREQRTKHAPIPELYQQANVLRIEQRYLHRLGAAFKVDTVTAAMLYDEQFYIRLLDNWRAAYYSIKKINDVTLNFQAMKTKKDLQRLGVLSLIEQQGGVVRMLEQITEAQQRGELTKKQAYDLRQAIGEANKLKDNVTVPSDAMNELDKKVDEIIRFYR